jgi:hypothetical protein
MNKTKRIVAIVGMIAIVAYLVLIGTKTAHAANTQSNIAIIDTGYDPNVASFKGKIIYEKCVNWIQATCPNGKLSMEGTGAAALTPAQLGTGTAMHGTEMLLDSIQTNPNTHFVFIRAFSISNIVVAPLDTDVVNILNWIYANRDTYNIGAVTMSFGRHLNTACTNSVSLTNAVNQLKLANIPVIAAAGNNYDYSHIDFPACNTGIISTGASVNRIHQLYSNAGAGLTIDALGQIGSSNGTSTATQVFGASWVAIHQVKPYLNYDQELSLIQATATQSSNQYVKNIPTLNLAGALK